MKKFIDGKYVDVALKDGEYVPVSQIPVEAPPAPVEAPNAPEEPVDEQPEEEVKPAKKSSKKTGK